jgi:hypothetical protein
LSDRMRDLEQRVRDCDRQLDELLGFVLAVALSPTGGVSDDLRRRALELTDLFDAAVEIGAVEPGETGETDNRKREDG